MGENLADRERVDPVEPVSDGERRADDEGAKRASVGERGEPVERVAADEETEPDEGTEPDEETEWTTAAERVEDVIVRLRPVTCWPGPWPRLPGDEQRSAAWRP